MTSRKVEAITDFFRLVTFLLCTPIIGIFMFIGIVSYGISLVCMFINDFIMEKLK
jgi:hypothetical protein